MVRGRDKFKKYKLFINIMVILCELLPLFIRQKLFEGCRMIKGYKGLLIRYILLNTITKECGDNVSVHPNVYLFQLKNLSIGNNVSIHPMCYIDASGGINIGNDVSIAHGSTIMSTTHRYDDFRIPIKDQSVDLLMTEVEDNVWIGAKTTILAGIKVGYGSVIGAGSVVTKDVPSNNIVGGVPAKKIKERA